MRAPSSRPATVALVVAVLAVLVVAGRLLESLPNATPPATSSAPAAGPLRLPDLIGQPLAQASTVLGQTGLKGVVQAQISLQGVVQHPKTPSGSAIVIAQDPRAGERVPPTGVVHVWINTQVQPNNTPRRVRLGAGPATAAYPIAVPGTATHQLTVLVAMPAAARVAIWLEPPGLDRRLPVAGTPGGTGCQPNGAQVHCQTVFAALDALDAEDSGLWRVQLAKHSALPADVQITVAVAPR
jgi:PASTA domain